MTTTLIAPKWFSLANYNGMSKWKEKEWLRAITARKFLAALVGGVSGLPCDFTPNCELMSLEGLMPYLNQIKNNPIAPINFDYREDSRINISSEGEMKIEKPIRTLSTTTSTRKFLYDQRINVTVDLAASDENLEKVFSEWLREQRGGKKRVKALSASILRNWADSKAVPYIDLMIFYTAAKTERKYQVIADLLFPAGSSKDAENVRKTTRRHAKLLLSAVGHQRLSAQLSSGTKAIP